MTIQEQLENLHQYASRQIDVGGAHLSMDELYDLWRLENLPAEELAQSVGAIREALSDMEAGDQGLPMEDHLARLRAKYNIPDVA